MTSLLDPVSIPGEPEFQLPQDGILGSVSADVPLVGAAACTVCGAGRVEGQDWCLECGTAFAATRSVPGVQTVALAGAFTLLLASGAVAAGVAAINDTLPARKTEVKVVAQTADQLPDDSGSVPLDDPVPSDSGFADDLPPIDSGSLGVPAPSTPSSGGGGGSGGGSTTPTQQEISLSSDAPSLYDPEGNAVSYNDVKYAIGKNATPSWYVTTPAGDTPGTTSPMDVGLNIDFGSAKKVTKLTLTTVTPGFTVQVLGTTDGEPPQSITDTRWVTLGQASSVDSVANSSDPQPAKGDDPGDKTLSLGLKAGGKKYHNIVLWFTVPPDGGPTVHISQLKFFG
ncbi:MAG: hypothetical protein F2813_01535 [Actinobacteria bacterium]|uniref:Unannotated protein n=1 Tax=freshwater metagenome TaxID=449393 RepID=A0A6J5ZDN8_9ZZZZ|nr:hypothetical protein [Actinomycetota bacterium]